MGACVPGLCFSVAAHPLVACAVHAWSPVHLHNCNTLAVSLTSDKCMCCFTGGAQGCAMQGGGRAITRQPFHKPTCQTADKANAKIYKVCRCRAPAFCPHCLPSRLLSTPLASVHHSFELFIAFKPQRSAIQPEGSTGLWPCTWGSRPYAMLSWMAGDALGSWEPAGDRALGGCGVLVVSNASVAVWVRVRAASRRRAGPAWPTQYQSVCAAACS